MSRKNAVALYLAGTLGQIWIICIITFILRRNGIDVNYTTPIGIAVIAMGGISSALWGAIAAIKYKGYHLRNIVNAFFDIRQPCSDYLFVLLFLFLDFFCVLFEGTIQINSWYIPILLFLKAIVFGGIEEIGWRYLFQPTLEERFHYVTSTIMTFLAWGVWHFSYFYIEGTLSQVQGMDFSAGLLVNCFILSALYARTGSLWICVMTHSSINVLSQLAIGGNQYVLLFCRIIIIVIAVAISARAQKKTKQRQHKR